MQEVREQKTKLNKGFSLVELIVVIAIMAVLIGVIGLQLVKYVGGAESTVDDANRDSLKLAAEVTLADPSYTGSDDGVFVISNLGAGSTSSGLGGNFVDLFEDNIENDTDGNPIYPTPNDGTSSFRITVTDGSVLVETVAAPTPTTGA